MGQTQPTNIRKISPKARLSSDVFQTGIRYSNGEEYQGEMKDNKRHGFGTYYYFNGDKYEGNWYSNLKHGKGTFFWNKTGEMYEGMFNYNKQEGVGIFYWKNGDRYHGEWKENKRHGKGILYMQNGSKFIGQFKYNEKHGLGELVNRNGDVLYEEWENGKLVRQSDRIDMNQFYHVDYYNECNTNKFEKYLKRKTQKQSEAKATQMKSKYFPLEMAKMLKSKNMDKIDSLRMIQSTTTIVQEKPDLSQWNNDDVIQWLKKINLEKLAKNARVSGIDGKRLLDIDGKELKKLLEISDKNELSLLMKNLEVIKNYQKEKIGITHDEIEENAISEEEDDEYDLQKQDNKENKNNLSQNQAEKNNTVHSDESNTKLVQELARQSKYFYSFINVNGLNYFINFDEITNDNIKVGQGGFGEVFMGEWQGKKVAIKRLTLKNLGVSDNLNKFINEINITSSLRHPNIVLYMGASINKDNYYMITEYLPKGSLFDIIHTSKIQLTEKEKIKIAFDTAVGIKYLHSRQIVHCDLKSSNVFLDDHYNVKLGDFGLSRFLTQNKDRNKGRIGTPHWMAPEILLGGKYKPSADIFSYGMILWELLTNQIPYHSIDPNEIVNLITNQRKIVEVPKEGNVALRKIITHCIQYEVKDRPSLNEILCLLGKVKKMNSSVDKFTQEIYDYLN